MLQLVPLNEPVHAVCAELEWERFLVTFKVLDGFLGRGLLQAFEALLTLKADTPGMSVKGRDDRLGTSLCKLYRTLREFPAARYKREAERLRVQEDLAETERKRNELRGLLAMYSNE
ncbi:MAG: hypothetical protein FRX49_10486 [Trebouxia sp. A1-2]|nr:MAG: hypothetical protein FRX49_10486 [Trebouxia sp. A1-2]